MGADEIDPESLTERQRAIKEQFVEVHGVWSDAYEEWLRYDPEFFDRFRDLAEHPHDKGALDPKVREFVHIAINCATTTLHAEGTRAHVGNALDQGATFEEILEVYQLASVQGIQSVVIGVPILVDEAGLPEDYSEEERRRQERLKDEFQRRRGYWADLWENILSLDPDYFETYMEFSSYPWDEGTLDPKVREFIYVAIDLVTTLLHEPGAAIHIENALEYGATRDEIMEILEIASGLGEHTFTDGVPILVEEARKRNALPD